VWVEEYTGWERSRKSVTYGTVANCHFVARIDRYISISRRERRHALRFQCRNRHGGRRRGAAVQIEAKPVVINTRQVALEMLVLAGRGLAAGLAVSVAAALLIVGIVTLTL
jgi:hypothetical protein